MKYAIGKKALGICDRCGREVAYLRLRKEWKGTKVCSECFEPKHPQLEPNIAPYEPQALFEPRVARQEPQEVLVGQSVFNNTATIHVTMQIGTATVTIS